MGSLFKEYPKFAEKGRLMKNPKVKRLRISCTLIELGKDEKKNFRNNVNSLPLMGKRLHPLANQSSQREGKPVTPKRL